MKNKFRIPLVVMSPKSLLRHPKVISDTKELLSGKFQEIIDDGNKSAKRVLCCTGKVYYDLLEEVEKSNVKNVALVRFEQLYPLPQKQLEALKKKYAKAEWCWVQEEPENMGAWAHIIRHISDIDWRYVGRGESASPAVGSSKIHAKQQLSIVENALAKIK